MTPTKLEYLQASANQLAEYKALERGVYHIEQLLEGLQSWESPDAKGGRFINAPLEILETVNTRLTGTGLTYGDYRDALKPMLQKRLVVLKARMEDM